MQYIEFARHPENVHNLDTMRFFRDESLKDAENVMQFEATRRVLLEAREKQQTQSDAMRSPGLKQCSESRMGYTAAEPASGRTSSALIVFVVTRSS